MNSSDMIRDAYKRARRTEPTWRKASPLVTAVRNQRLDQILAGMQMVDSGVISYDMFRAGLEFQP